MFEAVPWLTKSSSVGCRWPRREPRSIRLDVEPAIGAVRLALAGGSGQTPRSGVQSRLTPNGIVPAGAPLRITTFGDERALAKALAGHIAARSARESRPGARTSDGPHADPLVSRARERCTRAGDADFSLATTFNLDEFAGLDPSTPGQLPHVHGSNICSRT